VKGLDEWCEALGYFSPTKLRRAGSTPAGAPKHDRGERSSAYRVPVPCQIGRGSPGHSGGVTESWPIFAEVTDSQVSDHGRAPSWQCGSQGFESPQLHPNKQGGRIATERTKGARAAYLVPASSDVTELPLQYLGLAVEAGSVSTMRSWWPA
jgi:hypothetical protein